MGIGSFFHKIGIGFTRLGENSIPHTTQVKRYGNWGEDEFIYHIKNHLPNCQIKRNIVIHTLDGNAEMFSIGKGDNVPENCYRIDGTDYFYEANFDPAMPEFNLSSEKAKKEFKKILEYSHCI